MPTYQYVCKACGHELELFQSMTAPAKRKCPSCSKSALERRIGAGAGILFRGKGFYQTDYRSKSYQEAAQKESGAAPAPASSSDAESDGDKGSNGAAKKSTPKKAAGSEKKSEKSAD